MTSMLELMLLFQKDKTNLITAIGLVNIFWRNTNWFIIPIHNTEIAHAQI